ncbi:unnamed protein product [Durusdinium trenchii]
MAVRVQDAANDLSTFTSAIGIKSEDLTCEFLPCVRVPYKCSKPASICTNKFLTKEFREKAASSMNLYKKTTLKPDDVDVLALNMRHNFNISPLAVVHTGGDGLCEIPETTSTLLLPGDHLVCFLPSHTSERYKEWFEETISILRNDVWLNCRIENGPKKRLMRRGGGGENKKRKAGEVPTRPDDARGGHKGPEDDAGCN